MSSTGPASALFRTVVPLGSLLPEGAAGIDAGLTLTKVVRAADGSLEMYAVLTGPAPSAEVAAPAALGVTGARGGDAMALTAVVSQEIDAAARGVQALLQRDGRGGSEFVLALLGTGTSFAAVREGRAVHLGGTALGGGSFAGIARRCDPALTYEDALARATRGNRHNADVMVSEAYPAGIGRIAADLTAAHMAKRDVGLDDYLAGLLNLHGESLGQIAAGRALMAQVSRVVLAGGFVHENDALVASITHMAGLFGVTVELAPMPGFVGAIGAALLACDAAAPSNGRGGS